MEYFWAGLVSLVVLLIIYGIISSKIKDRRLRNITKSMLPALRDHIQAGKRYNIFLSHGQRFERVKFLGLSEAYDPQSQYLPFPLAQWLILEDEAGRRIYIKPTSIRYYEDSQP